MTPPRSLTSTETGVVILFSAQQMLDILPVHIYLSSIAVMFISVNLQLINKRKIGRYVLCRVWRLKLVDLVRVVNMRRLSRVLNMLNAEPAQANVVVHTKR